MTVLKQFIGSSGHGVLGTRWWKKLQLRVAAEDPTVASMFPTYKQLVDDGVNLDGLLGTEGAVAAVLQQATVDKGEEADDDCDSKVDCESDEDCDKVTGEVYDNTDLGSNANQP